MENKITIVVTKHETSEQPEYVWVLKIGGTPYDTGSEATFRGAKAAGKKAAEEMGLVNL